MSFISWSFFILFLIVLSGRIALSRRNTGPAWLAILLAASVIFYGWHVYTYLFILLTSTIVDYFAAIWVHASPLGSRRRKLLIVLSLVVNLGLLGFFKYTDFAMETTQSLLQLFGVVVALPRVDLILPMGLSFYTFVALSYTIDVYRGEIVPERNFWRFFLYVCFFPHLMAGPVIRAKDFLYQMYRKRRLHLKVFNEGVYLIIQGLFLKMVCANNLANIIEPLWHAQRISLMSSIDVLVLALGFGGQIYCDFAGYSNMARGMAYILGYRFPINFNNPYIASSFSNFWRRWHITLSSWLRDYLYISLGGNRISPTRTYVNLAIVMVLGGLWHGAAATYVIWGTLHGLALAVERLLGFDQLERRPNQGALKLFWFLVVQTIVLIAWIFFRSANLAEAAQFLAAIARLDITTPLAATRNMLLFLMPVVLMHAYAWLVENQKVPAMSKMGKSVLAGVMLFLVCTAYGINSAFIYFQF
jgi:alginate O-acetyltransferase complex protein AlgI